eukprot:scaffold146464_cov20-Tisochrysis_lutea.AAC.1
MVIFMLFKVKRLEQCKLKVCRIWPREQGCLAKSIKSGIGGMTKIPFLPPGQEEAHPTKNHFFHYLEAHPLPASTWPLTAGRQPYEKWKCAEHVAAGEHNVLHVLLPQHIIHTVGGLAQIANFMQFNQHIYSLEDVCVFQGSLS